MKDLNDLNALLAEAGDTRPWVSLRRRERCTNCAHEHLSEPIIMREEKKGHYVKSLHTPPSRTIFRDVETVATYAWCEKCSGERPLQLSLLDAIKGATNDRDLAQRAGHILADFCQRRRMGGLG